MSKGKTPRMVRLRTCVALLLISILVCLFLAAVGARYMANLMINGYFWTQQAEVFQQDGYVLAAYTSRLPVVVQWEAEKLLRMIPESREYFRKGDAITPEDLNFIELRAHVLLADAFRAMGNTEMYDEHIRRATELGRAYYPDREMFHTEEAVLKFLDTMSKNREEGIGGDE